MKNHKVLNLKLVARRNKYRSTWYEFELFTKVKKKSLMYQQQRGIRNNLKVIKANFRGSSETRVVRKDFDFRIPGTGKSTLLEKIAVEAAHKALKTVKHLFP
jgi:hypothetical protein